eukprot:1320948-Karenia_brevis.AAC.1
MESSWSETVFHMLPKKGDLHDPANYRPIAILPTLYKLFSKMLYSRLSRHLNPHQSHDQVGFRPKCWIEDAFCMYEGLVSTAIDYQIDTWICSIDLKKAFDRIEFEALFRALREHELPEPYVHLLIALYSNQVASVNGSSQFNIQRGVKQGDIISPLLFNCALEVAFKSWKSKLSYHGFLIHHDHPRFNNVRYADDILLFAKSKAELQSMVLLLNSELQDMGLNIHGDKTKILTTDFD